MLMMMKCRLLLSNLLWKKLIQVRSHIQYYRIICISLNMQQEHDKYNYLGMIDEEKLSSPIRIVQASNQTDDRLDKITSRLIDKLEPERQNTILKQMKHICEQVVKFISVAVETKLLQSEDIDLPSMIINFARDQRRRSEVTHAICLFYAI